jgi:pyruvate/2-oxoglutarate dehydrogenase complex dihydrolipoamide dehydrogenase (E3) component
VLRFPYARLDRAVTDAEPTGIVKILVDRRGKILGSSMLGARAGELVATLAVAMRNKLSASDIAETIHAYPTYALASRRAADRWLERQLDSPLLGLLGRVLGYRGVRKGSAAL